MTDIRKCDGPGCEVQVSLNEDYSGLSFSAESYITLERRARQPLHFHSEDCMRKWTLENTKGGQS